MENKHVVEIQGCKFEVDLAKAKKIEEFKVGDNVKVLKKGPYTGDGYQVYPGVIIAFEWFEKRPTITIAYIISSYSEVEMKFLYFNSETQDVEISHTTNVEILIEKGNVVNQIERNIEKKQQEIQDMKRKRDYFLRHFNRYFVDAKLEGLEVEK